MSRWISALCGLLALAVGRGEAAAQPKGENLALVGGSAITVEGDTVVRDSVILISGGKIEKVGSTATVPVPAGYKVVDTRGKWITPGLIDSNAHMVLNTTPEFFVKYENRLEEIALQSAEISLKFGITTSGDSWGPLEPLLKARERIRRGEVMGTRLLVAGNIIGIGGPYTPYFMEGWGDSGEPTLRYGGWVQADIRRRINATWEAGMGPSLLALTPEEVGQAMRAYIARGVDFVKVGVSGHGLGEVEPLMFSEAALKAMRAEARRANIPFQTHTFTLDSLAMGLKLDPTLMQHPNLVSVSYASATPAQRKEIDALIAGMKQKGVYAALMGFGNLDLIKAQLAWNPKDHPNEPSLNQVIMTRRMYASEAAFEASKANIRPWLNAGLKITIATDSGPEAKDLGPTVWGKLGRAHFERMEALQQMGMKPMEILRAATINGAEAYFLGDRTGSLKPGKFADILVVDADPLADIANLRRIHMVLKEGVIADRAALPTHKVLDYDPGAPWPY